jgi:hypothetical protein
MATTFALIKRKGPYEYVQVIENERDGKHVVQRVIGTLGRLDQLTAKRRVDDLVGSSARRKLSTGAAIRL